MCAMALTVSRLASSVPLENQHRSPAIGSTAIFKPHKVDGLLIAHLN